MTDEELWSRYAAAALCGLRASENEYCSYHKREHLINDAAADAAAMLAAHKERWPQKEKKSTDGELSDFYAGADRFAKAFSATNKEQP